MIQDKPVAPASITLALLVMLASMTAAGCAESSGGGGGHSDENFEIRAMIAADRQQMQSMDERLRRIESQIQDLSRNPAPPADVNVPPPSGRQPPPAPGPPPEQGPPPGPGASIGAPAAPGAVSNPAGEGAAPGAGSVPAGAPPASALAPAPETSERTTIASAPGPEGAATPSSNDEGASEGNNLPNAPQANANDEGGTTEPGNPEAQATPGAGAPAGGAAAGSGGEEGGAAEGGEEVASAPPASSPENAPAALPPSRWPDDLSRELQSSASQKGAAGKLFRSGLEAMKSRDYSAAVGRFAALQKKYPHSDLTEPAAYFSASALNEMGKYDQAILQYNDLVMRYPKGKYATEALLREAQAFVQINDKVDARLTLQKLINEHAGTPQAASAGEMMKGLESD